jgi:murein DD-endopeptidase MepM/ murein hydrolase activator NlpD
VKNESRLYILITLLVALSASVFVSGDFVIKETADVFLKARKSKEALEEYRVRAKEVSRLASLPPDDEIIVPVDGVRVAQITDTWHEPRGGERLHEGQDIFADRGTFVRSATDGIIRRIGDSSRGGHHVFITGGGSHRYYYAHLDAVSPLIGEDKKVNKGTIIGFVGNSGNATGTPPHLHFGIYTNRGTIDPLPLMVNRE